MKRHYSDILLWMPTPPLWFDDNGVPRYCEFHPSYLDIYSQEAVLFLIECQACGHQFKVAKSWHRLKDIPKISKNINDLAYGDPPNIQCCSIGPTMTTNSICVLQYWAKIKYKWERNSSFEIEINN